MSNRTKRKVEQRLTIWAIVIVALGVGAFFFYDRQVSNRDRVFVQFKRVDGSNTATFRLEQALTPAVRQKGLMFRKPGELAQNDGMVFVFPEESDHSFWMKDTYLPLDMIFLDRDFRVVGVVPDVQPLSQKPKKVGLPSIAAVELNAGVAKRENIGLGAKLEIKSGKLELTEVR